MTDRPARGRRGRDRCCTHVSERVARRGSDYVRFSRSVLANAGHPLAADTAPRRNGGAPTYLLTDNERTVTMDHVAGVKEMALLRRVRMW